MNLKFGGVWDFKAHLAGAEKTTRLRILSQLPRDKTHLFAHAQKKIKTFYWPFSVHRLEKLNMMLGERSCPFCHSSSGTHCIHLALAVEAREFVRRCVEMCQGQDAWELLCLHRRSGLHHSGEWTPEREDFTWLESAFCDEFLKPLRWFGGLDYEWRTGRRPEQGGFWVLLWSKDPQRLWWELRDEFERQRAGTGGSSASQESLFKPTKTEPGSQRRISF